MKSTLLCLAVFTAIVTSGCATKPVAGLFASAEEQQQAAGRKTNGKLLRDIGQYDHRALQELVNLTGDKITQWSSRQKLVFQFVILDTPDLNAFSTPGGYVYISRGLLALLNNEAELAAIIAHELGHIDASHGSRLKDKMGRTLSNTLDSVLPGEKRQTRVSKIAGVESESGYGPERETEACDRAMDYMARAGFEPEILITLFDRLNAIHKTDLALLTPAYSALAPYHITKTPDATSGTSLSAGLEDAKKFFKPATDSGNAYVSRLDGVTFGRSKRQGVARADEFYLDSTKVSLTLPATWRIAVNKNKIIANSPESDIVMTITSERVTDPAADLMDLLATKLNAKPPLNATVVNAGDSDGLMIPTKLDTNWGDRHGFTATFREGHLVHFVSIAAKQDVVQMGVVRDLLSRLHTGRGSTPLQPFRISIASPEPNALLERVNSQPAPYNNQQFFRLLNRMDNTTGEQKGGPYKFIK